MMEIDGLSYHHITKAINEDYMPTLKQMRDEEGYVLSRIDCGLPSQTSACQAGIMFGDNYDIPSFRWYDKDEQKLFVSGKDAAILDRRYAKGQGLMRGGSSINNMLAGDAEKSILTASNFKTGTPEEKKRRAEDIYLLALNPYFLMRVIVLFLGDVILEVWQGWRQRSKKVEPRLDRLHKFYPFVRASMTVLMRDVSSYLMTLDIIRGSPSIYLTWPGYDEVAHHSGPWTSDAFKVLRQYDRVIARIKDIIERKAPRPYDLLILSDHGQSFGHTFLQRYSYTLKDFVQRFVPEGTSVGATTGGDDGTLQLTSMAGELQNVQDQGVGGTTGKAIVKRAGKYADRATSAQLAEGELTTPVSITVCGSGNLGQIYFDLYPRRIKRNELDEAYPGLVAALAQHEGIGLVVVADEEGVPIALGKKGQRNLHTGQVRGEDPLKMYGDPDLRAKQVRRVADFPHVGDIMVLSTVYPDGTVAAMEELIGNHGGMGGEQTDAFLFHPGDMAVQPTTNSADTYAILNARRGTPAAEIPPKKKVVEPHGRCLGALDVDSRIGTRQGMDWPYAAHAGARPQCVSRCGARSLHDRAGGADRLDRVGAERDRADGRRECGGDRGSPRRVAVRGFVLATGGAPVARQGLIHIDVPRDRLCLLRLLVVIVLFRADRGTALQNRRLSAGLPGCVAGNGAGS